MDYQLRHEIDSRPLWAAILLTVSTLTAGPLGLSRLFAFDPPRSSQASEPIRITRDGLFKQRPAWSPDGKLLAFSRHRGDKIYIYLSEPDVSDERRPTP